MSSSPFARTIAVTIVVAASCAVRADAQPPAHLLFPGPAGCADCVGTTATIAPDLPALLAVAAVPAARDTLTTYVTPDGRFVLWFEPGSESLRRPPRVALHDVVTRFTSALDVPTSVFGFVGNPARVEIYLADDDGPLALSTAGLRRLSSPACGSTSPLGTSGDGRRLLFACNGDGLTADTAFVVDAGSGSVVATLPGLSVAALNYDGGELYAVEDAGSGPRLRRYEVATSAILGETNVPATVSVFPESIAALHVDRRSNRIFLLGRGLHIFHGVSLAMLHSEPLALAPLTGVTASHLDGLGERLYVSRYELDQSGATTYTHDVIDAASFGHVLSLSNWPKARFIGAPRPPAPALTAQASGGSLTLTWSGEAGSTTRYVLEVGTAPGRSDLAVDLGARTSVTVPGVPLGTYYFRARAGNFSGLGPSSNEVVVHVP